MKTERQTDIKSEIVRERERECVCVCVCMRERDGFARKRHSRAFEVYAIITSTKHYKWHKRRRVELRGAGCAAGAAVLHSGAPTLRRNATTSAFFCEIAHLRAVSPWLQRWVWGVRQQSERARRRQQHLPLSDRSALASTRRRHESRCPQKAAKCNAVSPFLKNISE